MALLNKEFIDTFDADAFNATHPFPWASMSTFVTDDGYERLRDNLPSAERFSAVFGRKRRHGQQAHDRYVLQYRPALKLSDPWRTFIDELKGPVYRNFVSSILGHDNFVLHFHWHYTPSGCSVSPHCDAEWKLGAHIFYFNHQDEWDPAWGGDTVILDDGGKFDARSGPKFEDFDNEYVAPSMGNQSLLFMRNDRSWHGVKPLNAPEDKLRKIFIVEIRKDDAIRRVRTALGF